MSVYVRPFERSDADDVFEIQHKAFKPLYDKYRDESTNPYLENKETVMAKYTREGTNGYVFTVDGKPVGAVRIIADRPNKTCRVSALCVVPQFQGTGIARKALLDIEKMYPDITTWELDTILQEKGNCRLYEKIGYQKTGKIQQVNEKMTLVFYKKII